MAYIQTEKISRSSNGGGGGGGTDLERGYGDVLRSWPPFSGQLALPSLPIYHHCAALMPSIFKFASKKGDLWAENFQIWGLVSWKFPNLGACELKFGWKLRLYRLKFPNFLKRGLVNYSFAWNGTLASGRRGVKRGSSGPHIPIPSF